MNEKLKYALEYTKYGWHIIPLHSINSDGSCTCRRGKSCDAKGKHPLFKGWYNNATTDNTVITRWWNKNPNANIGIATGRKSGILVLDIDPRHDGDKTLMALEHKYGNLPPTVTAITGGGGQHRIFKYPNGIKVPNKVSFAQGLDTRSDGGLIVAAPSIHNSGNHYRWERNLSPADVPVADTPDWLIKLMSKSVTPKARTAKRQTSNSNPVFEGNRNNYLTSLAGTMRRRGMSESAIYAAISAENTAQCNPPLDDAEVAKIARSISQYEPSLPYPIQKPQDSLLTYKMNDIGNAHRLIKLHGENIRFCPEWNCWLHYKGYWEKDIEGNVYAKARDTIAQLKSQAYEVGDEKMVSFAIKCGYHSRIEAIINQAKTLTEYGIPVVSNKWDSNHSLISLKNCTIDFRLSDKDASFVARENRREDFITKQLAFDYDSTAKCPKWESFLEDIIPDEDTRKFVQRAVGYTLTGSTREDMIFILHGNGCNGKTTFIETIADMLGSYAKTIKPETLMQKENSSALNTEIAAICGARLVKTSEIDEGKRLSESLVKQLTGGDTISTRFLFGKDFEYEPTYKVWISTNHKPKIYGDDNGIWRRICLIPFEVKITDDKKDVDLDLKLKKEIQGIFNWALEGLIQWKQDGLKPPQKVYSATNEYRLQEDLLQCFIDDCIEKKDELSISATELYKYYEWHCEQNGITKLSSTKFGTKFREDKGFEKKHLCGRVYYMGIKIKDEIVEAAQKDKVENNFNPVPLTKDMPFL